MERSGQPRSACEASGGNRLECGGLRLADAFRIGHVALYQGSSVVHAQLVVEEVEVLLELRADRGTCVFGQRPDLLLERAPDLLARFVDELLFGIALGPLV